MDKKRWLRIEGMLALALAVSLLAGLGSGLALGPDSGRAGAQAGPGDKGPQKAAAPAAEKSRELHPAAVAGQQTFLSIADAYVLQGYPDLNTGSRDHMWGGYDDSLDPDGEIARSLVQFDISGLPADESINRATLRVYMHDQWDDVDRYRHFQAFGLTQAWEEGTVTWDSQPTYGTGYGTADILTSAWGWYEFDVTDLVTDWYDGSQPNHGILLRGPEEGPPETSGWRSFWTREGDHTPELVVDHTGAGEHTVFMPLVLRNWPPKPEASELDPIYNDEEDGDYTVDWSPSARADGYSLQEDEDAAFSSPTTRYTGSGTSWVAAGQPPGTYYYRVKASNAWGDSEWSNVESVTVAEPPPDCTPDPPGDSSNIDDALKVCPGQTVNGSVGPGDLDDVFKIEGEAGQRLELTLSGSDPDADLSLFDPSATNVILDEAYDSSWTRGSSDESIDVVIPTAGVWYIDVFSYEGTIDYTLEIALD